MGAGVVGLGSHVGSLSVKGCAMVVPRWCVVAVGVLAIVVVMVLGLWFLPSDGPMVSVYGATGRSSVVHATFVDVYGSPAPGGAPSVDGADPIGAGARVLTDGLDSLAPVPLAMLACLVGLVPLWWAVRWLVALFHG